MSVLRDFTPEQPIDNGKIKEREHNAEDPPSQADTKGVRTSESVGYRDALASRICGGQQDGKETGGCSAHHR
jgi:hypothetical protein